MALLKKRHLRRTAGGDLRRSTARRRGFTILEVVAALAIFGLAATVLASAYVNVLLSYQALERNHRYEEDLRAAYLEILNLEERENFEDGGFTRVPFLGEVNWRTRLETTAVAHLFEAEIILSMQDPEQGDRREQRRSFFLYRPDWGTSEETEPLREATRERLLANREGAWP